MTTSVRPSQTALMSAAARAAHLIVDGDPVIFADPLAATLLGDLADGLIGYHREHGRHPVLAGARVQVTCRSRYTEDLLADAVEHGVDQYVLLGAGLDSFAHRSPLADRIRTFEVDAPDTQRWKRDRVTAAGLPVPAGLRYVPVNLEHDALLPALASAGFDPGRPALVSWLGVTMYLTRTALDGTLAQLGTLAPGSRLVLDHMVPAELRDEAGQTYVELVSPRNAEGGEPWHTFLTPDELAGLLTGHGFAEVASTDQREMFTTHGWERDWLRPSTLSRVASATVTGR